MSLSIHLTMLKFLLFCFGLAHAVTEADEAAMAATKADMISGFKKLEDGDVSRKVLFQSAVKSVSKLGTTLTPDEHATLQNVSDLLDLVLTEFQEEATARSAYVDTMMARMSGCDTLDESNLTTATADVDTLFNTHTVCRVAHAVAYQNQKRTHARLRNYQTSSHDIDYTRVPQWVIPGDTTVFQPGTYNLGQVCISPAADLASVIDGSWEVFIAGTSQWFTDTEATHVTLGNAYVTAYGHEGTNRTQCNQDQLDYETEACALNTLYAQVCIRRAACWSATNSTSSHANLQDYLDDNNRIPLLVQIIRYIKCIIGEIQKNVTATTSSARSTCASYMSETVAESNADYAPYFVNVSELSNDQWPVAADCQGARTTDMAQWLPFSKTAGDAHGYYDNVTQHADWVYNATLDNTFWDIITPGSCSR